jgi:hypothetical protein
MIGGLVYNVKEFKTNSGKPYCLYTIATFTPQGEGKDDKAEFHSCVSYSGTAETIIKYCSDPKNPRSIFTEEASLHYYKDPEGVIRSQIKVLKFEFADSNPNKKVG